jgi:hypothetical protein
MVIGGLLFSLQPSHDLSFLQEVLINTNKTNTIRMYFAIMGKVFPANKILL